MTQHYPFFPIAGADAPRAASAASASFKRREDLASADWSAAQISVAKPDHIGANPHRG